MRKNKALTPFFAVLLLLWIQVLDVGAATGNYEARIGTTYYNTLESAVGAAATGDTVEILSDVVLEATLLIKVSPLQPTASQTAQSAERRAAIII